MNFRWLYIHWGKYRAIFTHIHQQNLVQKLLEVNLVVFEDLGIYNSDPEKDKKINDELKSFLKSTSCKPVRIKIKNEE